MLSIIAFLFSGCDKENNENEIPLAYVNLDIYPNSTFYWRLNGEAGSMSKLTSQAEVLLSTEVYRMISKPMNVPALTILMSRVPEWRLNPVILH